MFLDQNITGQHSAYMAINLYCIISWLLDISEGATILFLKLQAYEQFAAIFLKIGATYFYNPVQFEYLP